MGGPTRVQRAILVALPLPLASIGFAFLLSREPERPTFIAIRPHELVRRTVHPGGVERYEYNVQQPFIESLQALDLQTGYEWSKRPGYLPQVALSAKKAENPIERIVIRPGKLRMQDPNRPWPVPFGESQGWTIVRIEYRPTAGSMIRDVWQNRVTPLVQRKPLSKAQPVVVPDFSHYDETLWALTNLVPPRRVEP